MFFLKKQYLFFFRIEMNHNIIINFKIEIIFKTVLQQVI